MTTFPSVNPFAKAFIVLKLVSFKCSLEKAEFPLLFPELSNKSSVVSESISPQVT